VVDVEDAEFWAAIDEDRFLIAQCRECGSFYSRRQACLKCGAEGSAIAWSPSPGLGTVRTFIVFDKVYHPYFEGRVPYNVAVVRLDEGAEITTNVIDCSMEELHIGMRVRMIVRERDGQKIHQASALSQAL
jgi:uncharacterized OB-fold protein